MKARLILENYKHKNSYHCN